MIKSVLDTNVLAAGILGFASAGQAPVRLLRLWQDQRFELVTSDHIVSELVNTMDKPFFRSRLTEEQIGSTQRLLQARATWTPVTTAVSSVAPHPEDDLVLAAAVSAGADYLVTGDKPSMAVGSHAGVSIVSPRAFFDLLEAAVDV